MREETETSDISEGVISFRVVQVTCCSFMGEQLFVLWETLKSAGLSIGVFAIRLNCMLHCTSSS